MNKTEIRPITSSINSTQIHPNHHPPQTLTQNQHQRNDQTAAEIEETNRRSTRSNSIINSNSNLQKPIQSTTDPKKDPIKDPQKNTTNKIKNKNKIDTQANKNNKIEQTTEPLAKTTNIPNQINNKLNENQKTNVGINTCLFQQQQTNSEKRTDTREAQNPFELLSIDKQKQKLSIHLGLKQPEKDEEETEIQKNKVINNLNNIANPVNTESPYKSQHNQKRTFCDNSIENSPNSSKLNPEIQNKPLNEQKILKKKFKPEITKEGEDLTDQLHIMANAIDEMETTESAIVTIIPNQHLQKNERNIEKKNQNFKKQKKIMRNGQNSEENSDSRKIKDPICIYINKEHEKYLESTPKLLEYVNENSTVKPRSVMRDKKRVLLYPETMNDVEELMHPRY